MSEPLSKPTAPVQKERIPELDGLRAISVALVIVYHSWLYAKTVQVPLGLSWLIDYVGLLGVKIFFVISGFIITRLMLEELSATGRFSARVFFIKRVFRIIPAFWTYLSVVTLLVGLGVISSDTSNMIPSLLFTSDFLQWGSSFFYAHSWSLSVEEQFYILFPLLVGLLVRKGTRFTTVLLATLYVLVIFSPNLGKIVRVHFHLIDIGFLTHFRYIIGGVLLSLWWKLFGHSIRRTNWLFFLAAVTCLLGMAYIQYTRPEAVFVAKYFFMFVEPALITVLLGWILYRPVYSGVLRLPAMQWLGRTSYSIYLWQQLFTSKSDLYLTVRHPGLLGSILLILLCATLSYYFIERPFNAMGRRHIRKRKEAAAVDNPPVVLSNV